MPYSKMLELYLEALKRIDDTVIEEVEWSFKRLVRNVNRFDSGKTADLPRRKAFIELFKVRIKEERDSFHPRLKPFIDAIS
jgi:hypothetical protein